MNTPEMLDCGHPNTYKLEERSKPGYSGGTGYANTQDGKRICYACAARHELEHMRDTGRAILYYTPHLGITDWADQFRMHARDISTSEGVGFYGRSYKVIHGRFLGPDGHVWSFRNAGDNHIARCRRTKELNVRYRVRYSGSKTKHYIAEFDGEVISRAETRDAVIQAVRAHAFARFTA